MGGHFFLKAPLRGGIICKTGEKIILSPEIERFWRFGPKFSDVDVRAGRRAAASCGRSEAELRLLGLLFFALRAALLSLVAAAHWDGRTRWPLRAAVRRVGPRYAENMQNFRFAARRVITAQNHGIR